MNLEANIEKIEKKVISNAEKIEDNASRIEKNSWALEILKDYKSESKRLFVIIIVILIMWFATIGYLVYVLNDTNTITETSTQEIHDIDTIENSNVINGDLYGEDKTN